MENGETTEKLLVHQKISNGISAVRILGMFWIVSVNFFQIIFTNFYNQSYPYTIEKSRNFIDLIKNQEIFDKIFLPFAYSGWAGVIIFIIISGFSLWFSTLKRKKFNLGEYLVGRLNGIYLPYFIAIVITILGNYFIRQRSPQLYDFSALILGASKLVPSAYVYNGPLWFMTGIILCYLFFPIFPFIYKKFRLWGISILTFLSFSLLFFWPSSYFFAIRSSESSPVSSALYPLLPFWSFFCLGILLSHLIFKYLSGHLKKINLRALNKLIFSLSAIIGFFLLYKIIYFNPSQNLEIAWQTNPYLAGLAGFLFFFSIGYLLPTQLYKPLRWLSRGTLGVFLYHYLIHPIIVPYIKPPFFT